jgi:1-acylglycerone phosphate reductase
MPLLDSEVAIAKKMFDVNVFALIAVTQAFSPLLIASKGTVVNIGSIVGKFPLPWQGYYNASKAAVNLLSDQLRIELSPFNVKVVNVVTGSVLTRFMENLASPPRLPPNSLYSPAKKEVEELMLGELALENAMKVEVYAEGVASNALKSNPKKIQWIGGETFLIWLGDTFGWATIWVSLLLGSL